MTEEQKAIKPTITNLFFVITTGVSREALNENNFINAYIADSNLEVQYPDCIYLLFQPQDKFKFRRFLDDERERTHSLIEDYDYENGYTVVVYALDMKWYEDFEIIKTGKYSLTSNNFQKLFPRVIKRKVNNLHKDELCLQYRIFNKTQDLVDLWEKSFDVKFDKEDEVWDGWYIENETLKIENHVK